MCVCVFFTRGVKFNSKRNLTQKITSPFHHSTKSRGGKDILGDEKLSAITTSCLGWFGSVFE